MKKQLALLLFFPFILQAQDVTDSLIVEKYLYDFCRCDYTFLIDTDDIKGATFFNLENKFTGNRRTGRLIYNGETVVSVQFSPDSIHRVQEEFIRIASDTFYYTRYDSLGNHRESAGLYYFDKRDALLDTSRFLSFSQVDYNETQETVIYHFFPKIKHGHWFEKGEGTASFMGNYFHGKRHGEWSVFNYPENSIKSLIYDNGILISEEERNLIRHSNNLETLEGILVDKGWSLRTEGEDIWHLKRIGRYRFIFHADDSYNERRGHSPYKGTWSISLENKTLRLGMTIYSR